ncbi:MAG: carboxylesterase family protein [Acidobacteriota bacterium]
MKRSTTLLGYLAIAFVLILGCEPGTVDGTSTDAEFALVFPIEGGYVAGMRADTNTQVSAFMGIPFAAPPVGDLRWKPPQPVVPWEGTTYEAVIPGPTCMQAPYPEGSVYWRPAEETSEDCLYLNVWTPANSADETLPVMVWIHGGALTRGSGSLDVYDGTNLAATQDVVVVTVNYRLNVFGYFSHPALSAESENGASGNYGVLDQVAALQWVQNNIGSFGGDPGNVTIFGESAGSWSVNTLVASPLADGLFHKAIGQSGGAFRPLPRLSQDLTGIPSGESAGRELAASLGIAENDTTLAELRSLPATQLMEAAFEPGRFRTAVVIDGYSITDDVFATFERQEQAAVPTMLGSTADELTSFLGAADPPASDFEAGARARYGERADAFLALYPTDGDSAWRATVDSGSDTTFACQMRTWARYNAGLGQGTYLYSFSHAPPHPDKERLGAFHAAEIAYAFDNLDATGYEVDDVDRQLAKTMSSYWASFARTGVPTADGAPEWPAYDAETGAYLDLGSEITSGSNLRGAQCDFHDESDAMLRASLGGGTPN